MPERKVVFRQNPNIEIRKSKQILILNDRMTKNNSVKARRFCHWNICALVIVSARPGATLSRDKRKAPGTVMIQQSRHYVVNQVWARDFVLRISSF